MLVHSLELDAYMQGRQASVLVRQVGAGVMAPAPCLGIRPSRNERMEVGKHQRADLIPIFL